jgi:hypothetical protein
MPNLIPHGHIHDPLGGDPMSGYPYDPAQGFFFVDHLLSVATTSGTPWYTGIGGNGSFKSYPDDSVTGSNQMEKAVGVWTLDTQYASSIASAFMCLGNSATSVLQMNGIPLGLGPFTMKTRLKMVAPRIAPSGDTSDFNWGLCKTFTGPTAAQSVAGIYLAHGNSAHQNGNGIFCWYYGIGGIPGATGATLADTAVAAIYDRFIWLQMDVSADGQTVTFKQNGVQIVQATNIANQGPLSPYWQVTKGANTGQQKIYVDTVAISYPFAN